VMKKEQLVNIRSFKL